MNNSVDRDSRDALETMIHELSAGCIDHVGFVRRAFEIRTSDWTVTELRSSIAVNSMDLYVGEKPSREFRGAMLRSVLLLRSNLSYEWRDFRMNEIGCLFAVFTAGLFIPIWQSIHRPKIRAVGAWNAAGDFSVWPFYRKNDFDAEYAKSCPFARAKAA